MTYEISLQPGHIARHTPRGAGSQGREAAVIDIAQDLLLRHLADEGLLDSFAIKGGPRSESFMPATKGASLLTSTSPWRISQQIATRRRWNFLWPSMGLR